MTWPLAAGLCRDVPADSATRCSRWASWPGSPRPSSPCTAARWLRACGTAELFSPTPLSLTFSDHCCPKPCRVCRPTWPPATSCSPTTWCSWRPSRCRAWARSCSCASSPAARWPEFVAGLFYAFFPYRLNQLPHLQTLSSQWIPLALFGFRRYFDRGRAGAAGRRRGGVRRAGPLDRLLPLLLRTGPRRLRDLGAGSLAGACVIGGHGPSVSVAGAVALCRHAAVPAALRRGAGAVRPHPAVQRDAPLFRGPARLPQRALSPPFLGRAAHAVPAGGRRPVRGRRPAAAGAHRGSAMWAKRLALTIREATVGAPGARAAARLGLAMPAGCWRSARSSSSPPAGSSGMWAACRSA